MAGQNEFLQAMAELVRLGESNEGHLSVAMIADYFSDMDLSDSQMDSIAKYLKMQQIEIDEWTPSAEADDIADDEIVTVEDPLDHSMVEMYLQEADQAVKLTQDQEQEVIRRLAEGDDNAKGILIEANLGYAAELATAFKGKGMQLSDLIQESNIGLMLAVGEYMPEVHGDFRAHIENSIRTYLEEILEDYNSTTKSAMKMANKINELNDVTTAFAKEFGREGKPEEIARRMGVSEEEVRDLMKVSLDAISVIEPN